MNPILKQLLLDLLFIFYIMPGYGCAIYYTLLRMEDMILDEYKKHYSKDKFSYPKMIGICLIPILNLYMMLFIAKDIFLSILSIFKKPRD